MRTIKEKSILINSILPKSQDTIFQPLITNNQYIIKNLSSREFHIFIFTGNCKYSTESSLKNKFSPLNIIFFRLIHSFVKNSYNEKILITYHM